ncbi:MAG: Mrp/NBP35 family ATP-binding protein [Bacteroidales bacterium]|jgi:ATP-binding protein involved in chromosome partitioning|nr:Mrp/NBP35 family ATP-binding protein [Bacteroidales bacterium]
MSITIDEVTVALQHVVHPATGKDIVASGMVEDLRAEGMEVHFTLFFAKAGDPLKESITVACEKALRYYVHPRVQVYINVRQPERHTADASVKSLPRAKYIVAVASGKGGVGKSTVAANLAVALAREGYNVCLLDADIYGPSAPKMLGVEGITPEVRITDGGEYIVPVERYGVRMLSVGFFVHPEEAVIWRGPMAANALRQLLHQGDWGDHDYLLIDLPPGTGDIPLTVVQELPVTGAVIVSTPQQVALADVTKSITMFRNDKVNVPVLGLVENMAWFTPAELPDNRYYLFGKDGCKNLAEREHLPLLGQIPIVQSICDSGDNGQPVAAEDTPAAQPFLELSRNVVAAIHQLKNIRS